MNRLLSVEICEINVFYFYFLFFNKILICNKSFQNPSHRRTVEEEMPYDACLPSWDSWRVLWRGRREADQPNPGACSRSDHGHPAHGVPALPAAACNSAHVSLSSDHGHPAHGVLALPAAACNSAHVSPSSDHGHPAPNWRLGIYVNFGQFPCSSIRIHIPITDTDPGEPNQGGSMLIRILLFSWFLIRIRNLLINMMRYKLFRWIFFDKTEFIFLSRAFLLSNCQIISVFQSNFTSNSFLIRSYPDLEWFFSGSGSCCKFRIRPDPQHCSVGRVRYQLFLFKIPQFPTGLCTM